MSVASTQHREEIESNLIVTDSESAAAALQQALCRLGENGVIDKVVSLDHLSEAVELATTGNRRVFVGLGEDPSRGLEVVRILREQTSASLFVVGPRDAGLILEAVHAGADSFIEDFDPLDESLARALALRKKNGKASGEGKLICISSVRGGCGGSVLSANVSVALAQRLKRVALCDFDCQNGVCDALLTLRPKHNILDLVGCAASLDRNSIESALTRHSSGTHLLSAPSKSVDSGYRLDDLCQRVIRLLRQMFPAVVVDLPRFNKDLDSDHILSLCTKLVLITQMEFNAIRSTRRMLDHLERIGLTSQRVVIVGNREGLPNSLSISHAEEALNYKLSHVMPDDPKAVYRSVNCGSPFYGHAAGSALTKKLDLLADSLLAVTDDGVKAQAPRKVAEPVHSWQMTDAVWQWISRLMETLTENEPTA